MERIVMDTDDSGFIPYLVLIRFDKGEDLRDRLEESLPVLRAALAEIGEVEPVTTSYDGSAVSYLLAARPAFQPGRIIEHLQSTRLGRPSALKTHDKALVLALECAAATRMDRVTDWLRENGCLSER
jgi:hypothetical protein